MRRPLLKRHAWLLFVAAMHSARGEEAAPADPPLKPARSQFDLREFDDLINFDLSVPHPRGPLPTAGQSIRTFHGQVVDSQGQPIADAQIALAEPIGRHNVDFDQNYDKTDELGRFLVQGDEARTRLVVRRGPGQAWNVPLAAEQDYLRIEWPAPSRVRIAIDPGLCPPDAKISLSSLEYWAGMAPLRRDAALDADGAIVIDDLLPGSFRVYARLPLVMEGGGREYAEREFGQLTIAAGEDSDVRFDGTARIPVRGDAGPDGACVVIERQRTRYEQVHGYVDGELIGADGKFLAHVPGPGVYRLIVKARPVPMVDGKPAPDARLYLNGNVMTRRFVVDEMTTAVEIEAEEAIDPTVAFVHRTLDSEGPRNVTFSHIDVQAAQLVRHQDRPGVAAELLRILNDPHAPQGWGYATLQALGGMTETPSVVDGLLALLDEPSRELNRGSVIKALHNADADLPRIVDRIAALSRDEEMGVRWSVVYYVGRMAHEHPELNDQIAPVLIAGLGDASERIRSDAAATLGWLEIETATTKLKGRLADPNEKVRLAAARAVWLIDGNRRPLVELTTEILWRDDGDYEMKKEAMFALRDIVNLPKDLLGALALYAGDQSKPPFSDHVDMLRYQLGNSAREILKEHEAGGAAEP